MTARPGQGGAFAGMAAALSAAAAAGQAGAGGDATLPPGARHLGRFLSMRHALQAFGVPMAQAAELAGGSRKPKPAEVRHQLPGDAPRLAGCTLIVRRMPGNHAEAWAVSGSPAPGAAPAPAGGEGAAR